LALLREAFEEPVPGTGLGLSFARWLACASWSHACAGFFGGAAESSISGIRGSPFSGLTEEEIAVVEKSEP
jgi:hypothetical protein